jgi:hypothetical protein
VGVFSINEYRYSLLAGNEPIICAGVSRMTTRNKVRKINGKFLIIALPPC